SATTDPAHVHCPPPSSGNEGLPVTTTSCPVRDAARAVSFVLLACALACGASATTVVRQSLDSLSDRSDVVVRGTVESVEGHAESGGHPFRIARVRVGETLAGRAPAVVPVRLPGGVDARGMNWAAAGVP